MINMTSTFFYYGISVYGASVPRLNLDDLNKHFIRLPKQDVRVTTAHIPNKLKVTTPTARSRMKAPILFATMVRKPKNIARLRTFIH
jgi:hypothetical protein